MKLKPAIIAWAIALGFIVMLLFINGCSLHEWNKETWHLVQSEYPDCKSTPMPTIYYSDKLEYRGIYCKDLNWVILRHPNDLKALAHEFRHACGDDLGELPIQWEKGI